MTRLWPMLLLLACSRTTQTAVQIDKQEHKTEVRESEKHLDEKKSEVKTETESRAPEREVVRTVEKIEAVPATPTTPAQPARLITTVRTKIRGEVIKTTRTQDTDAKKTETKAEVKKADVIREKEKTQTKTETHVGPSWRFWLFLTVGLLLLGLLLWKLRPIWVR